MRPAKTLIGINDKWLIIIGIPLVGLLTTLMIFNDQIIRNPSIVFRCFPISICYTIMFWFALRGIVLLVRDYFFEDDNVAKKLLVQFIAVLVVYCIVKMISDFFLKEWSNKFMGFDHHPYGVGMIVSSLTVAFLVLSIYEGVFYFSQYKKSLIEQERLKKERVASQLEGLKNQVNPHFLFNSMNTLAQLIPEDSDRAVKFVEKMSKVYRYILEIKDKELVTLDEEITFLNAYLFLLKERFEENLQVDVSIPDETLKKKILPLSLQLLIENAIKHNITSTDQPLSIKVGVKNNQLFVENKLQRKNQVMHSTKTGLDNIKSRYSFFTKVSVLVAETTENFKVTLPLID